MVVDREQWEKSNQKLEQTVSTVVDNPGLVWDAVKEPYVKAWEEGRPGEAIGRGTFEVVTAIIGTKGADKLAKGSKLGTVAKVADKVEDVAKVADKGVAARQGTGAFLEVVLVLDDLPGSQLEFRKKV
jgi:hypothetical protein